MRFFAGDVDVDVDLFAAVAAVDAVADLVLMATAGADLATALEDAVAVLGLATGLTGRERATGLTAYFLANAMILSSVRSPEYSAITLLFSTTWIAGKPLTFCNALGSL